MDFAIGIIAYVTFRGDTQGNVLLNFSPDRCRGHAPNSRRSAAHCRLDKNGVPPAILSTCLPYGVPPAILSTCLPYAFGTPPTDGA